MSFSSRIFKIFLIAFIFMMPFVSVADDIGLYSKKLKELNFSIQDTVKGKSAAPKKEDPKNKPDVRDIQDKLKDSRSSIKQVPRSIPKLKPQPVTPKVKIKTPKPTIKTRGVKIPF